MTAVPKQNQKFIGFAVVHKLGKLPVIQLRIDHLLRTVAAALECLPLPVSIDVQPTRCRPCESGALFGIQYRVHAGQAPGIGEPEVEPLAVRVNDTPRGQARGKLAE